jgi:NADH:ubiquinone oxidoreductase subunit 6 (subunit J)
MLGTTLMIIILVLGYLIISTQSPIAAILAVIGVFTLTSAIIALEGGLSILSLTFLIIYVGAIAILFLFITLLLNLRKTEESRAKLDSWWSFGMKVGLTVPFFILSIRGGIAGGVDKRITSQIDTGLVIEKASQLDVLTSMYNSVSFWLIGIILLVAMLGVILLSKENHPNKT